MAAVDRFVESDALYRVRVRVRRSLAESDALEGPGESVYRVTVRVRGLELYRR